MTRRARLDAELVRRGLTRSREQAAALIAAGRVSVAGVPSRKPATGVGTDAAIVVHQLENNPDYVSRGGHKLAAALDAFAPHGLTVAGRRCLDAGASTGGFTDVLLRREAAEVVAVDVGYGQLAWRLRQDHKVMLLERTNVRDLDVGRIGGPVDVVVADLSFVSLRLVLPTLADLCRSDGDLVLMVKPQFEVGRDRVGKNGVVRDPAMRAGAVVDVARAGAALGWGTRAAAASPLPGPAGNVEYFLWLRHGGSALSEQAARDLVTSGPTGEKVGR